MSSKLIVNLPSDAFQQQIKKKHQGIVESEHATVFKVSSTDPAVRINQLEQNIKFLQEQHQIMLAGLHREIEILRLKNRDLQFQMVFTQGVNLIQNTPSSDEELPKNFSLTPENVNITPLQIEILERNIADLRTNLSEAKTRNVYLQNVIDEQKKKISSLEKEKLDLTLMNKKCGKENVTKKSADSTAKKKFAGNQNSLENVQEKLEDADRLIRRLRRENEEQRKEIVSLRTSMSKGKTEVRRNETNNGNKVYHKNGQSQTSRFPPLNSHPHWRHRSNSYFNGFDCHSGPTSSEWEGDRLSGESEVGGLPVPSLPYLRDRNNASTSTSYGNPIYGNYQAANYKRWYHYHKKQDEHRSNGRPSRREQCHQHRNDR